MLNVVIIDDDEIAILFLVNLLKKLSTFEIKIAGTANNLNDGIALIKKTLPQIVFLDVQMPGRNGLDIYTEFKKAQFKIIFCTAYKQYAIDALKISASGYLLKPVDLIELQETLQKAIKELKLSEKHIQLEDKNNSVNTPEMHGENIVFDVENGFVKLNTRNIEYCFANNSYCKVITNTKKEYVFSISLRELEDKLPLNQFYRTHKSYLVNIYYIRKYIHAKLSYVLMKSGIKIPVAVRTTYRITNDIKIMLK
jgi:two-component system, LytTR family, response regulator